ncbi:hypothetical protein An15g05380 [Aspergillus niger]|uniref:Uncharacterized protein n=2 Tax=Aspergillus niger TaxID=5061 RepID=A2R5S5_ASPNC|nr:hypothetical protein An15g05380 [Aspergillus niger]CAK42511.1 hypothetical protein An15g05380 [Aspergillus niger]
MPSLIPRFQAGTAVYEYEKTAILILVRLQPEMQGPRQLWCFASSTNERNSAQSSLIRVESLPATSNLEWGQSRRGKDDEKGGSHWLTVSESGGLYCKSFHLQQPQPGILDIRVMLSSANINIPPIGFIPRGRRTNHQCAHYSIMAGEPYCPVHYPLLAGFAPLPLFSRL